MSRLLFAAARGARIQALDNNLGAILSSHAPLELSNDKRPYRIHPDDEHLQYGPISTALRNYALGLPLVEISWFYKLLLRTDGDLQTLPPFDRYVFLLLMSEALADEGM
jgi:hypothetical protein